MKDKVVDDHKNSVGPNLGVCALSLLQLKGLQKPVVLLEFFA